MQLERRFGMSTKLASRRARADCAAMNPDSRPMSLTMPMPLGVPTASTCAQPIASVALSTAVSKPKDCGHEIDVVVDGLGDADDGNADVALAYFLGDGGRRPSWSRRRR